MLDLYHATRDDLIRMLLDQQGQQADRDRLRARQAQEIVELRQAVAMLSARIGTLTTSEDVDIRRGGGGPSRTMPGHKPEQGAARVSVPRKRRGMGRPACPANGGRDAASARRTCGSCACPGRTSTCPTAGSVPGSSSTWKASSCS